MFLLPATCQEWGLLSDAVKAIVHPNAKPSIPMVQTAFKQRGLPRSFQEMMEYTPYMVKLALQTGIQPKGAGGKYTADSLRQYLIRRGSEWMRNQSNSAAASSISNQFQLPPTQGRFHIGAMGPPPGYLGPSMQPPQRYPPASSRMAPMQPPMGYPGASPSGPSMQPPQPYPYASPMRPSMPQRYPKTPPMSPLQELFSFPGTVPPPESTPSPFIDMFKESRQYKQYQRRLADMRAELFDTMAESPMLAYSLMNGGLGGQQRRGPPRGGPKRNMNPLLAMKMMEMDPMMAAMMA